MLKTCSVILFILYIFCIIYIYNIFIFIIYIYIIYIYIYIYIYRILLRLKWFEHFVVYSCYSVVYSCEFLVNLDVYSSSFYLPTAQSHCLIVIGGMGGGVVLSALCHSCNFACQERVLKTIFGLEISTLRMG